MINDKTPSVLSDISPFKKGERVKVVIPDIPVI
jgi:hypothetical protein